MNIEIRDAETKEPVGTLHHPERVPTIGERIVLLTDPGEIRCRVVDVLWAQAAWYTTRANAPIIFATISISKG